MIQVVGARDAQIHMGTGIHLSTWSVLWKRKFELQASTKQKPSESLETKGKRLRGAMTEAECFVFEEIINFLKDTGQ